MKNLKTTYSVDIHDPHLPREFISWDADEDGRKDEEGQADEHQLELLLAGASDDEAHFLALVENLVVKVEAEGHVGQSIQARKEALVSIHSAVGKLYETNQQYN